MQTYDLNADGLRGLNAALDRLAQRIDNAIELAASGLVAGNEVHSSNAMVIVASRRCCISVERSGLK